MSPTINWQEKSAGPERIYAIGDIHGELSVLKRLTKKIETDLQDDPAPARLVFLGDYIDRGLDSAGIINFLLSSPAVQKHNPVFLMGNHEDLLLQILQSADEKNDYELNRMASHWRMYGGDQTLESYGLVPHLQTNEDIIAELRQAMGPEHLTFYKTLPVCFEAGDYYFVHAGIRPGVALQDQRQEDLLWIRDKFLMSDEDHGKIIVHGHTPCGKPELNFNRIGIDTGAVYGNRLTAVRLESGKAPHFISVGAR